MLRPAFGGSIMGIQCTFDCVHNAQLSVSDVAILRKNTTQHNFFLTPTKFLSSALINIYIYIYIYIYSYLEIVKIHKVLL